jgi:N-acetylmuramoyl-L-alanine amidase
MRRLFQHALLMSCMMLVATYLLTDGQTWATLVNAQASLPTRTVFLDPGHGNGDAGATFRFEDGMVLREADIALSIAHKTAELLREKGYRVVLSREKEYRAGHGDESNGDGRLSYRDDLQDVVDMANELKADIFISMHHNGSVNYTAEGVEVYYCEDRDFASDSYRLAMLTQANLLQGLRDIGYAAVDRGVKDDSVLYAWRRPPTIITTPSGEGRSTTQIIPSNWRGHLFVLGPERPRGKPRATNMPGVLGEALFVSNPTEAQLLASERGQWAIARGYANAVVTYFESMVIGN